MSNFSIFDDLGEKVAHNGQLAPCLRATFRFCKIAIDTLGQASYNRGKHMCTPREEELLLCVYQILNGNLQIVFGRTNP